MDDILKLLANQGLLSATSFHSGNDGGSGGGGHAGHTDGGGGFGGATPSTVGGLGGGGSLARLPSGGEIAAAGETLQQQLSSSSRIRLPYVVGATASDTTKPSPFETILGTFSGRGWGGASRVSQAGGDKDDGNAILREVGVITIYGHQVDRCLPLSIHSLIYMCSFHTHKQVRAQMEAMAAVQRESLASIHRDVMAAMRREIKDMRRAVKSSSLSLPLSPGSEQNAVAAAAGLRLSDETSEGAVPGGLRQWKSPTPLTGDESPRLCSDSDAAPLGAGNGLSIPSGGLLQQDGSSIAGPPPVFRDRGTRSRLYASPPAASLGSPATPTTAAGSNSPPRSLSAAVLKSLPRGKGGGSDRRDAVQVEEGPAPDGISPTSSSRRHMGGSGSVSAGSVLVANPLYR